MCLQSLHNQRTWTKIAFGSSLIVFVELLQQSKHVVNCVYTRRLILLDARQALGDKRILTITYMIRIRLMHFNNRCNYVLQIDFVRFIISSRGVGPASNYSALQVARAVSCLITMTINCRCFMQGYDIAIRLCSEDKTHNGRTDMKHVQQFITRHRC